MQNPPNHPSLSGHRVNGTTLAPTSGLGPKSPNHSNEDNSGNSQGTVNATHCLNSASSFSLQSQAFPVLGQLASYHHMDAATTTRSNFGPQQSNVDTAANSQGTVNATLSLNSTSTFSLQSQTFAVLGQLASHHHVDAATATRSNFGHHQSIENTANNQGTVNATLSLNSASTFSSQSQVFPVSGQLASHHHVEATRTRRVNFNIPISLHRHSSSDPFPIRPQNTVNLNLVVGHNSSININLLSSNPPSQVARNITFGASTSTPPIINNAYNPTSSYSQPPFFNLCPTGEPIPSRISEMNGNPQFTRHHSPYASPTAATVRGETPRNNVSDNEQEIPTAIPCPKQSTVNLSQGSLHQRQPSHPCPRILNQNHTVSQSGMGNLFIHPSGSHLFNQPTRYCFPGEKHNYFSAPSSSTLNSTNHQVLVVPGGENLPAFPGSHPVTEEVTEQAPEPNCNDIPLPQTELVQALSQAPSQNDNTTATTEPSTQAGGRNSSSTRHKSHPYSKHGPYTCHQCNAIFECGYRYAAHMNSHYKDETPVERKKRRESKIRNRDLHIAQSPDGITVMPGRAGSFQQEGEPINATDSVTIMSGPPPANITNGKANQSNQREEIPFPTKVEPEDV